jgi:hypothetical protein
MSEFYIHLDIDDNSPGFLAALEKSVSTAWYAVGLTVQANVVKAMSEIDETGRDTVDTGRLRRSMTFITSDKQSPIPAAARVNLKANGKNPALATDRLKGRAPKSEMLFGSNVEYATWVNNGTEKMQGHRFMQRGIVEHKGEYEALFKDVLKGDYTDA